MPSFGASSLASLSKCHPLLQEIAQEAIKVIDFKVLDSTRNRVDQERAFATGRSKARFGQSAHNYVPAIAFDLFPAPYDWNDRKSFKKLADVIMKIAAKKNVPLRWGGDWHMDGDKTTSDAWDMPHFELHKWRDWAKKSKLYEA
jgi:peptidoglycan L-alanyl-D-glutamate endopeptidase CwlK